MISLDHGTSQDGQGHAWMHPPSCYQNTDRFPRSFATAWEKSMKIHEVMADNRMKFASTLNEMSEDLNNLAKEVDRSRKQASTSRVSLGGRDLMFGFKPRPKTYTRA